ncbi:MAG: hypothetical protein KGH66_02280 [Candidatus Micrarchaeota archaeon]|nr:hypothetical protein [Candidatus Micrarchaeota archaeon]
MRIDEIKNISLGKLLTMLHDSLSEAIKGIDAMLKEDKEVDTDDIKELRDHIIERLGKEDADTKKLLKLMGLMMTESAVLELIKSDAEEWVHLLDAVEDNVVDASKRGHIDKEEVEELRSLTKKARELIRR